MNVPGWCSLRFSVVVVVVFFCLSVRVFLSICVRLHVREEVGRHPGGYAGCSAALLLRS